MKPKICIVISTYNSSITKKILFSAKKELKRCGVNKVKDFKVPGAFEIPVAISRLSKKYDADQALDFFVANFLVSDKAWIGNLAKQDGTDNYVSHRAYKDSFSYNFRSECRIIRDTLDNNNIKFDDLFLVDRGQHPPFFKLLSSKRISYQTFCVFENFLDFIKKWDIEESLDIENEIEE